MLVMFRIRPLVRCSATGVKRQWLLMYRFFRSFVVVGKDLPPQNVVLGLAATSPTDASLQHRRHFKPLRSTDPETNRVCFWIGVHIYIYCI